MMQIKNIQTGIVITPKTQNQLQVILPKSFRVIRIKVKMLKKPIFISSNPLQLTPQYIEKL